MANTFLNVAGRGTVQAGNNPEQNVAQVNNQNIQQPVISNTNTAQNSMQNTQGISPITIPIQIQPQLAQIQPQLNQVQPTAQPNIQTLAVEPQTPNNAPTPQQYQGTQNNNAVSYDQIYSSYQSAYGTNPSNNVTQQSGIKKTSLGTTIVTPTVQNLNTVEGQYQSEYSDSINGIIGMMLTELSNGFQYDPNSDNALKAATEYSANSTLQSLAGSGVLNSTATAERVARIVSDLIPVYEEKAHDRWLENIEQFANTAQIMMSWDNQRFSYWKDAKDREFQEKEFEYKKQQDALDNAWKRVDELGYVDNEASTILGVKVGTLSGEARQAKEQREFELQKMREQAEIEYANNKALTELRSELNMKEMDKEYQLDINKMNIQNQYDRENTAYEYNLKTNQSKELARNEYELQKEYGSSSNSNSNYEKYDEIIKNRYASYDNYSKQYIVPDEQSYNELGNYLDNLNASGLITDEEFLRLSAKYSKYGDQIYGTNSNTNSVTQAGLNDTNVSKWIKALDGNNSALNELGVTIWGQTKSNVNNKDAKKAVNNALSQIKNGDYKFTTNQQLMNDLKNGRFGNLGWGL